MRQAAKQRVKCSSFSDPPSPSLFLSRSSACALPCPTPVLSPAFVISGYLASRRPMVKTFGDEMLALAKPRRVAKPNRRNSEIVKNAVPLIIRRQIVIHVKCLLRVSVCASISRYRKLHHLIFMILQLEKTSLIDSRV